MSKNLPKISDAEFEIMKVVWDKAPISTNDVIDSFKIMINGVQEQYRQCL